MRQVDGTEALERARSLRQVSTNAERKPWAQLRGRRLEGFKFRRQVWIGAYIADFLCIEAKLVVEADGSQHDRDARYDEARDAWLAERGYRVLRFWNSKVESNLEGVIESIRLTLLGRVPSPSHAARGPFPLPLPVGEGI